MKFNLLSNFKNWKILTKLGIFWKKIYRLFFFFLLTAGILFGGFVWRRNLHTSTWSQQRIEQFKGTQENGVIFNESNYQKALEMVNQRKADNANIPEIGRDFFH
ncbi:MAG: hypothetical protein WCJ51_01445 [Candidatus Moraniibacteriota bacterium]